MTIVNPTTLTYLCGGAQVASIANSGVVKTMWPNYGAKVHMEVLLGNHTATFPGMVSGTPYDGDLSRTPVLNANNPWGPTCMLLGKTSVFLRLHYSDAIFANGLPTISFHVSGKSGIYDPRTGAPGAPSTAVVARPTTLLNGWGNNVHAGPYELGQDEATNWGLNDDTTYPYLSPDAAVDNDTTTAASVSIYHDHKYAGCIWSFSSVASQQLYLNVLSEIPLTASNAPVTQRSAGIWYSLDGGNSFTELYNLVAHPLGYDSVLLPLTQDMSQVQVMAFTDSHDDMSHTVYDITVAAVSMQASNTVASPTAGYTENAALCIADYLAHPVWGFGSPYGTEIPLPQLIAAANICDEAVPLAEGGTESRYALNGQFNLEMKRGEVLQNMLTSCGGRLTYSSGQFVIWPAAWTGAVPLGSLPPVTSGEYVAWAYPTTASTGTDSSVGDVGNINVTVAGFDAWAASEGNSAGGYLELINYNSGNIYVGPDGQQTTVNPGGFTGAAWSGFVMPTLPGDAVIQAIYPMLTLASPSSENGAGGIWAAGSGVFPWQWEPQNYTGLVGGNIPNGTFPAQQFFGKLETELTAATVTGCTIGLRLAGVGGALPQTIIISFVGIAIYYTSASEATPPVGSNLAINPLVNAAGPFRWRQKLAIRDLYNGVKGTYISPVNNWEASDIPPYAQDNDHGYYSGSPMFPFGDANLAADGGDRRWLDIQLPFTISVACAQRLCKIELLRRRQQGTGTFIFNMAMYQATVLDIIEMTLPLLGWTGKLLEISAHRFTMNKQQIDGNDVTLLGSEIDVQETDPSVYEWSTTDELSAAGFALGSGTGATAGGGGGGTTVASYATYSNTPAVALTQTNSTTIALAAVSVSFAAVTLLYNARTITIPAPTAPQWYYITIADPDFYGDAGSTSPLQVFAEMTTEKCDASGYIYMGAIQVNASAVAALSLPGGEPAPDAFLVGS